MSATGHITASGPVADRQVLAGTTLKPKVSFQAGREAKVSSAEGWNADLRLFDEVQLYQLSNEVVIKVHHSLGDSMMPL